jgi:3-hydroxyisobutyrate dehydrogenase
MMLKDLKLAQQAAAGAGVPTPLGGLAESLYAMYVAKGYGQRDFSGMLQFLRGELSTLD